LKEFTLQPIGIIKTPFKQKFGIPRQSQALSIAKGEITFCHSINPSNACRGLDAFSHLWLSFIFHENIDAQYRDLVRPPRLGGNQKIGVFASRSTFRPNPIGLSLVKNLGLNKNMGLDVEGVDLVDGTPIVDIKPFVEYADAPLIDKEKNSVFSGYAQEAPTLKEVVFDNSAAEDIKLISRQRPEFLSLVVNVLEQDPRPAYKKLKADPNTYTVRLHEYDITWKVEADIVTVSNIKVLTAKASE
jgi:tRNA-Thr(GGU) m(6)t(6)A37 methyltransferase TsaA